ncbi:MAG: hypothetical protein RQ899_07605 [Pseudomonadales bacterium]|nr:hypothetical protein [Pseudomonadales bacterium]
MLQNADHKNRLAAAAAIVYCLFYLFTLGDLSLGTVGWTWNSIPITLERLLALRSGLQFEAVAMAELGYVVFLVSPGNLLVAALLGSLLGLNVHGALSLRQRRHCGLSASVGSSAGALPALLAGGACCAPSLLLLLGIPGLGAFITLFSWLVPVSILLLLSSRWWQRHQGAEAVMGVF